MNHRENMLAVLNYQAYDNMPVVHFGYWRQTLQKWANEGHITQQEATCWKDGNVFDEILQKNFDLFKEIIDTVGILWYETTKYILECSVQPDYAHYWEDICFKNGPLVIPSVFDELVGIHYAKINNLLKEHDIHIVSVDCDGYIDHLLPTWLKNGVNTMFPIEVGTWNADIKPWREQYGKELRGVGGMNKNVFAGDYADIDKEIDRLKPLMSLGGYIPCPDHRIPPDAKFESVQYYCEQLRKIIL